MAESVPVRCPNCRREHTYTPPVYPCACGAPVTLPVRRGRVPRQMEHRTWAGSWVRVRCASCGTEEEWPRPEMGCSCGTTLQLSVVEPHLSGQPGAPGAGEFPLGEGDLTAGWPEDDLAADGGPAGVFVDRDPDVGGSGYEGADADGPGPEQGVLWDPFTERSGEAGAADGPGAGSGADAGAGTGADAEGDGAESSPSEGSSSEGASTGSTSGSSAKGRSGSGSSAHSAGGPGMVGPSSQGPLPPRPRPAFRPVTIRTAQDARTAAAQYLRWLGFPGVRMADKQPASGVDVRGPGVVGHVDPTTSPTQLRDIETLWLNGLNETAVAVCFSLAGYARDARARADTLGVPLFVLDLTGTPQPVNDPADELLRA